MKSTKNFIALGLVVSINLLLQFIFQWYIIVSFGAGSLTDAFFGALALPQFILLVLSGSLTMVLIPVISRYSGDEFLEESWNYFQGVGILFASIAVLLMLTAQWWVAWLLPGFKAEGYQLAVTMSRIQLAAMFFSALLSVLWAIHSARGNFILIESTSIAANLISLLLLVIAAKYMGIIAAAWVSVLRVLLQVVFLMRILGHYRKPHFNNPSFREVWTKLKPLIAGNVYFKTDTMVDRYLTSTGVSGELTLLNLAQQLYMMATNILNKVFINTLIPSLSQEAHAKNWKGFYNIYLRRLWLLLTISGLSYLLVLLVGRPIMMLAFSFKNFSADDVHRLWVICLLLFGFWFGGLLGNITAGTFYSKGDTRTPTVMTVILFTIYVPVKIYCFRHYGISGLALSISAYMLVSLFLQLLLLELGRKKRLNEQN